MLVGVFLNAATAVNQRATEPLSHCAIIEQLAAVSREISPPPHATHTLRPQPKKGQRKTDCQPKSIHTEHFKRLKCMACTVFNCIMHSGRQICWFVVFLMQLNFEHILIELLDFYSVAVDLCFNKQFFFFSDILLVFHKNSNYF